MATIRMLKTDIFVTSKGPVRGYQGDVLDVDDETATFLISLQIAESASGSGISPVSPAPDVSPLKPADYNAPKRPKHYPRGKG